MECIGSIVLWILWSYLSFFSVLLLLFSIAGRLGAGEAFARAPAVCRFALLIPAYKEDRVIVSTATEALVQTYPREKMDVVVIADSLQTGTLQALEQTGARVIPVSFPQSTKAKAINQALHELPDDFYTAVVLLDADNLMAPDVLQRINDAFVAGAEIVQCHRTAKNLNTSLAVLDAISEEINNHIFRRGHRVLGLSAALIGSGMAFRFDDYKQLMKNNTAIGGFDKELELTVLRAGKKIVYLDDARVYDEKVDTAAGFARQRKRWLAAQGHYFRRCFPDALVQLVTRGNIDYFDKALQMIQPPRILQVGLLFLLTLVSALWGLHTLALAFAVSTWLSLAALLLAVPRSFYTRQTLKALVALPTGFFLMLAALLKSRGANKTFLHTEHKHSGRTENGRADT